MPAPSSPGATAPPPAAEPPGRSARRPVAPAAAALALLLFAGATGAAAPEERDDPALRAALASAITNDTAGDARPAADPWVTDMTTRLARRVSDPAERSAIVRHVRTEAGRAGLPPELVLAVIDVESGFQRYAVSRANAQGLMQVMRFWLAEFDLPGTALFDVQLNIRMGCTILRHYYDLERGNWTRALGRYNGSLGRRDYPARVFERLRTSWSRRPPA
jgi:soluble lytic murein transglycosylase-like protein